MGPLSSSPLSRLVRVVQMSALYKRPRRGLCVRSSAARDAGPHSPQSMKKRMSSTDAAMIFMERREAPQHGSILFVLRPPPAAPDDYMQQLFAQMREHPVTAAKFNGVLARGLIDRATPAWELLAPEAIDIDYHFRHSALPAPGGELELGMLISRLVAHPLDMSRPPWELHLIEGLEDGRFAIYAKMHHALIDGMTMMRVVRSWLSEDAEIRDTPPLWAHEPAPRKPRPRHPASPITRALNLATAPIGIVPEVGGAVRAALGAALGSSDGSSRRTPPRARSSTARSPSAGGSQRSASRSRASRQSRRPPVAPSTTRSPSSSAPRCAATCQSVMRCPGARSSAAC